MTIVNARLPRIVTSSSIDGISSGVDLGNMEVCYEVTQTYVNGLPYPITVIDRDNFEVTIPNTTGHLRKTSDFCIYVTFSFRSGVIIDASHLLDDISESSPKVLQALKKAVTHSSKHKVFSNMDRFQIVYKVTKEHLLNNGGNMYLDDLDIAICNGKNDFGIVHPESADGREIRFRNQMKDQGFGYKVVIVDPENVYGFRYINIGGMVYKIKPVDDDDRDPGVYLLVSAPDHNGSENKWHYHSFDDADKNLPLFKTASDAQTFGDVASERKAELEQLESERKREAIEMQRIIDQEKHRYEKKSLELKTKMENYEREQRRKVSKAKKREAELLHKIKLIEAELDRDKSLRDSRLSELKYELDTRQAIRKDSSDSMKYLLPVIVGAGAFLIPKLL